MGRTPESKTRVCGQGLDSRSRSIPAALQLDKVQSCHPAFNAFAACSADCWAHRWMIGSGAASRQTRTTHSSGPLELSLACAVLLAFRPPGAQCGWVRGRSLQALLPQLHVSTLAGQNVGAVGPGHDLSAAKVLRARFSNECSSDGVTPMRAQNIDPAELRGHGSKAASRGSFGSGTDHGHHPGPTLGSSTTYRDFGGGQATVPHALRRSVLQRDAGQLQRP